MTATDRLLPHDDAAERAVLGSILIENAKLSAAQQMLDWTDFYKDAHGTIFRTMERLADQGFGIDEITVKDELARTGDLGTVGGLAYIAALSDRLPFPEHVKDYARIVREKASLRSVIKAADTIQNKAYTDGHDPAVLLAELERGLDTLRATVRSPVSPVFELRIWDLSVAAFEEKKTVDWLVEPILAPPDVISLVGDGGIGKSKLAAAMALAMAFGKPLWGHFQVRSPGSVIYVNEERPDLTLRHLHTLAPSMGIDPTEI